MIAIETVKLPEFGCEELQPTIPLEVYRARLKAVHGRMAAAGIDVLFVYADREHFANICYLTGFDPRFEEAVLMLDRGGKNLLITGNECMGFLPDAGLGIKAELFQDFSLMGQQRDGSRPLREIVSGFGIKSGTKVGCVGWKYYDPKLTGDPVYTSDLPAYLVDLLRELAGDRQHVTNATGLFLDVASGLRVKDIEPEQLALFEYAAVKTSLGVRAVVGHFREGVREDELEKYLESAGLPLSCHRMVRFGENAKRGLGSPTSNRAKIGDAFTTAIGIVGSLTARAGYIAKGPEDVGAGSREFYGKLAANYFDVVTAWYEALRVGVAAGDVHAAVEGRRDKSLYDLCVNPGHYLHLEEWSNSPFARGSTVKLASGMAIQMDIIPMSKGPWCCSNVEDGVVLADEKLRRELAERFPGMWGRVQARRAFMREKIGIALDESVLPLSNTPAYLAPYALSMEGVFVKR